MVGIVEHGSYIPRYRIKAKDIAEVWGQDGEKIEKGLGIKEKAVGGIDEDTSTISVEAARNAMERGKVENGELGAMFVGSESHPYAVKPTGTIVAEALNETPNIRCADLEFACKAGTAGLQMVASMVESNAIDYGMSIGADTAQGRPGDALEYAAASGGAAMIVGEENVIAEIEESVSYTTDTPDFWRRQHSEYPSHGGRFTGEPAYFKHVLNNTKNLMEKVGTEIEDYDYVVFHQPNSRFPKKAAKKLGVEEDQLETGLLTPYVGNTYSGAPMLGLAAVLDEAEPNDKILLTSYGSGAGSDSFHLRVTENINKNREDKVPTTQDYIDDKEYINYSTYVKYRKKLKK